MKTIVVIPTYNEHSNITPLIKEIFAHNPGVSVMVVDDNSPDGTAVAVKELMPSYPTLSLLERPQKDGLGGAYIAAFRKIAADPSIERVVTMDADFSHSPADIKRLREASGKVDLVIGSRYVPGGAIAQWEPWRRLLSRCGNWYVRTILQKPISDWTSGFTCINAARLRALDMSTIDLSGYAFLQELKYLLVKAGASVHEVPILFGARRGGESKISGFIIREGIIGPWKMRFKK